MKRKLDLEQDLYKFNEIPPKRRKTEEDTIIGKYNLEKVKATKEWTEETFKIVNNRLKGEALEIKSMRILRAQGISTTVTKAHIIKETPGGTKLQEIIGDGGIDLFGEMVINGQTLQWIGQCKMTKRLANNVINEMKGLLATRPNTFGIIVHGGNRDTQLDNVIDNIFICHIEDLHRIREIIEAKYLQGGIKMMVTTSIYIHEMENAEFDGQGRIMKAKRIKEVKMQIWGITDKNEDILFK